MRFHRQLLLLALTFAAERATGLAILANSAPGQNSPSSSSNRLATELPPPSHPLTSQHDVLRKDRRSHAIERAPRPADAAPSPSSSTISTPGLVVPAYRSATNSAGASSVTLVEVSAAALSSAPATTSVATMSGDAALSIFTAALSSSILSVLSSDASRFFSTFDPSSIAPATAQSSATPSASASSFPFNSASPSQFASQSASLFPSTSQSNRPSTSSSQITSSHTSSDHHSVTFVPPTHHRTGTHTDSWHTSAQTTTTSSPTTSTSSTSSNTALRSQSTPTAKPSSDPAHPIDNAQVAGIVSSIGAAAILGALAAFYIWHRKRQGKYPLFGPRGSKRSAASDGSVYPKSAWLYDPVMTPDQNGSRSRSGSDAEQNFLPNPVSPHQRPLSEEVEANLGLGGASPNLRASDQSPLLRQDIPEIRISGDGESVYRSGGRRSRPMMSSIDEDEG